VNVQEYISSGIIESYALGMADESERAEFERLCLQYPEIAAARADFEKAVEQNILANAMNPPAQVKERFLEAIEPNPSLNQPKIITMENVQNPVQQNRFPRFLAAASIILLLICLYFSYEFYNQNKSLKTSNQELQTRLDSTDAILNQIVDEQKKINDSSVTVVNMVGTQISPHSSANIYWDSAKSDVYLVVRNMPKLASDKQYQLWALINGKPKDLGVFDVNDQKFIVKMKNTEKAEAFAITIEQKGGSPSPTLEKMQSLGKIKGNQ
jgi:anti-sigma-K factor RskA